MHTNEIPVGEIIAAVLAIVSCVAVAWYDRTHNRRERNRIQRVGRGGWIEEVESTGPQLMHRKEKS